MAERNLIREGFVFNTRNAEGTVSGSQYVSPSEINRLVDQDLSTLSLTVSGGENTVLDADLGARWKLDRIELYTNEVSSSSFSMSISENNLDYREVVMTGSAGLWVGDIDPSTVLGAPRYIRYEHSPAIDTSVFEWVAVNEEDLLDFGSGGNLTSLNIDDSPIGSVSTVVEPLVIKNNFSKSAEGFVFIDRVGTDADDELEISVSPNGPWFGRNSSGSNQPSLFPWENGQFLNTRVVPSGIMSVNFADANAKGWGMKGATQAITDGRLRGTTTDVAPIVYLSSEFLDLQTGATILNSQQENQYKFAFRAGDADVVKVLAQTAVPPSGTDLVEGPRLFWKTEENVEAAPELFRSELSILSTVGNAPLKSTLTEYSFDVGSATTWSGTIRGLAFQPFTAATGIGYLFDFVSIEVANSAGEVVGLETNAVNGLDFSVNTHGIDERLEENYRAIISNKHQIQADCIITKVGGVFADLLNVSTSNLQGLCLIRELSGSSFPSGGNNFDVPYGVSFDAKVDYTAGAYHEAAVFWQAKAGDKLAAISSATNGIFYVDGDIGASYASPVVSGVNLSLNSLARFENIMNHNDFVLQDREYLIFYESISPESLGYKLSGTYRTPVFDTENDPTLSMLDYETITPSDSTVDSLGQVGFDSVRARGSSTPPVSSLGLGEVGQVFNTTTTTFSGPINSAYLFAGNQAGPFQINMPNNEGSYTQNISFTNIALATMYHAEKDELWVLNGLASGTNPIQNLNVSPVWDVLSPSDGSWIRTDSIKGNLPYGYDGGLVGEIAGFFGVGFLIDYTREEIYIIQRRPAFTLGAGSYFGVVLDLDGNFKDLIFRNGTLNTDVIDNISSATRFFSKVRDVTYAEDLKDLTVTEDALTGVYFVLFDNVDGAAYTTKVIGDSIAAFRNGSSLGIRDNQLISWKSFSAIPGLGFTTSSEYGVKAISYNTNDGRIYLFFDNLTGTSGPTNRQPETIALDVTFNETSKEFDYSVAAVSGTLFDTAPNELGFSKLRLVSSSDPDVVNQQNHDYTMGASYCSSRDTFFILRTLICEYPRSFPKDYAASSVNYYNQRTVSFLYECGAGTVQQYVTPTFPSSADSLWGTLSGTLSFEDIASDGVNFPAGRFVQVEYQLNASSDQLYSPYLLSSNIAQGLRIGQISAGGTKEIYIRTNIPEGKPIVQQQGRLKVFWESSE